MATPMPLNLLGQVGVADEPTIMRQPAQRDPSAMHMERLRKAIERGRALGEGQGATANAYESAVTMWQGLLGDPTDHAPEVELLRAKQLNPEKIEGAAGVLGYLHAIDAIDDKGMEVGLKALTEMGVPNADPNRNVLEHANKVHSIMHDGLKSFYGQFPKEARPPSGPPTRKPKPVPQSGELPPLDGLMASTEPPAPIPPGESRSVFPASGQGTEPLDSAMARQTKPEDKLQSLFDEFSRLHQTMPAGAEMSFDPATMANMNLRGDGATVQDSPVPHRGWEIFGREARSQWADNMLQTPFIAAHGAQLSPQPPRRQVAGVDAARGMSALLGRDTIAGQPIVPPTIERQMHEAATPTEVRRSIPFYPTGEQVETANRTATDVWKDLMGDIAVGQRPRIGARPGTRDRQGVDSDLRRHMMMNPAMRMAAGMPVPEAPPPSDATRPGFIDSAMATFRENMRENEMMRQQHPNYAASGRLAGDVGFIATTRLPTARGVAHSNLLSLKRHRMDKKLVAQLEALAEADPKAAEGLVHILGSARNMPAGTQRSWKRMLESERFQTSLRELGKAAETGVEAALFSLVKDEDPMGMMGLAMSGQLGSSMLAATFGMPRSLLGLAVRAGTWAATFRLLQEFNPVRGEHRDIYEAMDASFGKVALGLTVGVTAQLFGGRFRGSRGATLLAEDWPKATDFINTIPRGTLIALMERVTDEEDRGQNTTRAVMEKLSREPTYFGEAVANRLNRSLENGAKNWGKELDSLIENNDEFRAKLEAWEQQMAAMETQQ